MNNQNNCVKNATNTNKEQGKHQRSHKQNDQNLKRKNGQKQGEYERRNLINNRKDVTFNHNRTQKL